MFSELESTIQILVNLLLVLAFCFGNKTSIWVRQLQFWVNLDDLLG